MVNILDKKADKSANLSKDNSKVKTIRFITRFNIVLVTFIIIFTLLEPFKVNFSDKIIDILTIFLGTVVMVTIGNIAPKIPFNRYTGFRLPWTIRDEETWKVAHKILGYTSFPIALIMVITSFYFEVEIVISMCVIIWILIPALYSLYFYYKKMKKFVS